MERKFLYAGIAVVVVVAGIFAAPLFLPKSGETFDEALPGEQDGMSGDTMSDGKMSDDAMMDEEANPLHGRDGHSASGTVRLIEAEGQYYLRFEDVEQTQGPDVYLYLTEGADAYGKEDVESGVKVLVPQGEEGQFTARGTFNVPIPDDVDITRYNGITTWCDRFSVPFSSAAL